MNNFIKYKSWYTESKQKLVDRYGAADLPLIAGIIAATSAQNTVEKNYSISDNIYLDYRDNPAAFNKILNNKTSFYKKYGLFKPHYNNIKRVIAADIEKKDLQLSGNKVNNFYQNLIGNLHAVTIDTWMLKVLNHPAGKFNNYKVNKKDYKRYTDIISEVAKEKGLLPAEYQAVLWTKARYIAGYSPINYGDLIA
jgi:hypothetical protein